VIQCLGIVTRALLQNLTFSLPKEDIHESIFHFLPRFSDGVISSDCIGQ